jgi:hypothetical protein
VAKAARRARSQPRGRSLGVSQSGGLSRPGSERLARGSLRDGFCAERDKQGKAVQPWSVQDAECVSQRGVVLPLEGMRRGGRLPSLRKMRGKSKSAV